METRQQMTCDLPPICLNLKTKWFLNQWIPVLTALSVTNRVWYNQTHQIKITFAACLLSSLKAEDKGVKLFQERWGRGWCGIACNLWCFAAYRRGCYPWSWPPPPLCTFFWSLKAIVQVHCSLPVSWLQRPGAVTRSTVEPDFLVWQYFKFFFVVTFSVQLLVDSTELPHDVIKTAAEIVRPLQYLSCGLHLQMRGL